MGEMYRQLASAQLRGTLYKTGYKRTKASPKEVQIGTTSQNTAINYRMCSKCCCDRIHL